MTTAIGREMPLMRKRFRSIPILIAVIALGLPTRLLPHAMPDFMVNYGGDALWALMIFLLFGLARPAASTRDLVILTLIVTWGIEFSQLYKAGWLNAIRDVEAGRLVLGTTFLWSDLWCYAAGIAAGALLDKTVLFKTGRLTHED